jgi:hypothetical protein
MKAAPDWKLWACIALGVTAIFLLPPQTKSLFDGSHLFGALIVLVRVALGTVLGVCGYLLLFDAGRHSSTREDQ